MLEDTLKSSTIRKTFSFRIQKFPLPPVTVFKSISPSTRYRIEINFACPHPSEGIRNHSSTQGSSAIKVFRACAIKRATVAANMLCCCCCASILVYCSLRDWTRICHFIGFENIRIHRSTHYRIH